MRAIWTGSISFGLVNIPVKMFSGASSHRGLDLKMLHNKDKGPIRYARICRKDGKEIPYEDIVKGYEYQDGDYIILTAEDFEKANVRKTKTIDIKQFAQENEIDSRYYEKPYYLEPEKGSEKAYALLREALSSSGKIALVKFAMRARDYMGAIKSVGKALVLNQMRFPADVRSGGGLSLPEKETVDENEIELALALINQRTKPFIPEDWHDTYVEQLEKIVQDKAKGKKPAPRGKEPQKTKVEDLMATLKASLNQA